MAIIIIDFDNTITKGESYPEIDDIRPRAKEVINKLYDDGHCIIINTCRCDKEEDDARRWLNYHGVSYCHINENCEVRKKQYGNDTRKIGGFVHIDDKNLECMYANGKAGVSWDNIESMLEKVLKDAPSHEYCIHRRNFVQSRKV